MNRGLTFSQKRWKPAIVGMGITCLCAPSAWALPKPVDEPPVTAIVRDDQVKGQSAKITVIVRDDKQDQAKQAADEKSSDKKIVVEVDAQATPPKMWLGLALEPIDGGLARYLGHDHGVLIESVYPDSPAEKAELKEGDIIIAFHEQEIKDPESLLSALRQLSGEGAEEGAPAKETGEIEIKVLRRGETKSLKISPAARPESVKQPKNFEINVPELKEMAVRGGSIFKFGNPVVVPGLNMGNAKTSVTIFKNNDNGKTTEVKIESADDQPPKITVTDEQGSREVDPNQLDSLPEKLRKVVQQALERKSASEGDANAPSANHAEKAEAAGAAAARAALDRAQQKMEEARKRLEGKVNGKVHERSVEIEAGKAAEKAAEKAANLESQIREQVEKALKQFPRGGGSGVVVITPEWAQDMQKSAEKMAQDGLKKAGQFAAMPDKIAELQEKIDKLQKQVEELTQKLEERTKPESK